VSPYLVIGIGNPSRGDDALGPAMIERLEVLGLPDVELLTDFQLQVEYALDLRDRAAVIFVDAAVGGPEPFAFEPTVPAEDASFSSHELSPSAVLHTCQKLFGQPPPARTLAIRGYDFELGAGLSPQAQENLEAASDRLVSFLQTPFVD
jgi:hydrogenase maturation protease